MNTGTRCILAIAIGGSVLSGCKSDKKQPTTRPASMRERQERALDDPFAYDPMQDDNDVSGGKLHELKKDSLKKDLDHVLNP